MKSKKSEGFPKRFNLQVYNGADESGVRAFEIGDN
jgi:hypothetical protein